MRRAGLVFLTSALFCAGAALAEEPAAGWDDSHMRSRYRPAPPSARTRFEGESGYAALARGGMETKTEVPAQLEFTSQRQWLQGTFSSAKKPAPSSSSSSSIGSVHRSGTSGPPSSSLRSGSVHSSR